MGSTDSFPIVSQVKSGVQAVCGDREGAARTQHNFIRDCPVVSQVTSTVQLISGNVEGAVETQKRCGKAISNMIDGIPIVGHTKGLVHKACGDKQRGDMAILKASRVTTVLVSGAAGTLVAGPAGAAALALSSAVAFDATATAVMSKKQNDFRPIGYVAGINKVMNDPKPGETFDLLFMVVADDVMGSKLAK